MVTSTVSNVHHECASDEHQCAISCDEDDVRSGGSIGTGSDDHGYYDTKID